MTDGADLVAGEPRAMLREALLRLRSTRRSDGAVEVDGEIPEPYASPIHRALNRVIIELVADDERRHRAGGPEPRPPRQLRADAFMALVLRVADHEGTTPGPAE